MTETARTESTAIRTTVAEPAPELDARRAQRAALKTRHSQSLAQLLAERSDLRGVHALADLVDESVRWTA